MDTNRKYQRLEQGISSLTSGLATGVMAGVALGPVAGVALGGLSAIGGGADMAISERLYKEQKSFTQDMHEYQLDNVRALPNSIAKTTAYTKNNKLFPILEYYTCTQDEKDAVARIIANQGMTLNVIDTPLDYLSAENEWTYTSPVTSVITRDRGFIQCQLIKISDVGDDSHIVQAISEELQKGIYTKQ